MTDRIHTGPPHDCVHQVELEEKIRPDLLTKHIPGTEVLYTNGCCFLTEDGTLRSGFAVVRQEGNGFTCVASRQPQGPQSAQRAEIQAVVEALKEGKGKDITIYTDSAYAYGAVHVKLPQWKRGGFLTAAY